MSQWSPNEQTLENVDQFLTTLMYRLPYILGIDELIPACEIINTDPEGVGAVTPRYITVTINRYHQLVLYRGSPTINVGDLVSVVHFRDGDLYEVLGPGGPSGVAPGGGGAPTNAQYVVMALDATLTAERKLTSTANEIIVNDGGAGGNVTLTAGSLIVQTDQVNTFSVGPQTIQTGAAGNVGFIIQMAAAQWAMSFQIKNSGGTVLSGFDDDGVVVSYRGGQTTNFFAGAGAGESTVTPQGNNVYIGWRAGQDNNTQYNVCVGTQSGTNLTSGYNTGVGHQTMLSAIGAGYNTCIGCYSLQSLSTGDYNFAGGYSSGPQTGAGSYNTYVGQRSGLVSTGSYNIYLGSFAGSRQVAVSNVLIIDNQQRADAATDLTHAIVYGTMAAAPESQQITFNVATLNVGTDANQDVQVNFTTDTNNGRFTWMRDEDYFQYDDSIVVNDYVAIRNQNELRFYDNGNYVGFEAPALSADQIWVLPTADGAGGEFLSTNGAGTLSWASGGGAPLSSTTVTAAGPTDNLDVSNINIVYIDTNSNDVTIGGFVNGVAGQFLFITVIDNTEDAILEHAEGTGNQDMYLYNQGDQTLVRDYGGWVLVCDGSNWYQVGGAGSAW